MRLLHSVSVALIVLSVGCSASKKSTDYVTRAELRELLGAPGVESELAFAPERSADLARLASATFVAPASSPTSAPQASATADRYTARLADALKAVDTSLDVCARNIANAQTTAFKASRAVHKDDGSIAFQFDLEQGSLENTNRPLDLGISGNGFFKVKIIDSVGDGFGYTRNGNFFVNNEGQLVLGMGDGYKLEPPIMIPQGVTEISVSESGVVQVLEPGKDGKSTVGQLKITQFINAQGLNLLGGSIYLQTEASGPPAESIPGDAGAGKLLQGFLEGSNVDLGREYIRIRFLTNWRNAIMRAIDAGR